jgi:hypothetical protein
MQKESGGTVAISIIPELLSYPRESLPALMRDVHEQSYILYPLFIRKLGRHPDVTNSKDSLYAKMGYLDRIERRRGTNKSPENPISDSDRSTLASWKPDLKNLRTQIATQ